MYHSLIGFLNSWASDEKCLERSTNVALPAENVFYVKEKESLLSKLNDGQVGFSHVSGSNHGSDYIEIFFLDFTFLVTKVENLYHAFEIFHDYTKLTMLAIKAY